MQSKTKPFRITVEHWNEKIVIELEHSDVSFVEYMDMLEKITTIIYSEELWDNYFKE